MSNPRVRAGGLAIRDGWVLITGAAAGIGQAVAHSFAARGARLILADSDRAGVDQLASDLRDGGAEVLSYGVDVADRAAMQEFSDWVHMQVQALDVLVNGAALLEVGGLEESAFETWDELLGVNLMGVVHACRMFLPAMRERGRGAVVNIASAGMVTATRLTAYGTTKFAVVGFSQALRSEYFDHGVVVSVVSPTLSESAAWESHRMSHEQPLKIANVLAGGDTPHQQVAEAVLTAVESGRAIIPVGLAAGGLDGLERIAPGYAMPYGSTEE